MNSLIDNLNQYNDDVFINNDTTTTTTTTNGNNDPDIPPPSPFLDKNGEPIKRKSKLNEEKNLIKIVASDVLNSLCSSTATHKKVLGLFLKEQSPSDTI